MPTEILLQDPPVSLPYRPARLSVDRYLEMIASGIIQEDDRIELLEGVLVEKMTKNPPHTVVTRRCDLLLTQAVPAGWHVRNQEPIVLPVSVPEPDLAVVRGEVTDYAERHPRGNEIGLIVEVADSSVATDRYKSRLYAAAGIPHYWLVDLSARSLDHYWDPDTNSEQYRQKRTCSIHEMVPLTLDGHVVRDIPLSEILL